MRLRVAVASPELIRRRSSGVVVSAKDLFDPAIFGPSGGPARVGHLELVHPCLHPAFSGLAAHHLGLSQSALQRRLATRGAVGLREELADACPAFLEALPVPAPARRPRGSKLDAKYRAVLTRTSPASLQRAVDALFRQHWLERDSRVPSLWRLIDQLGWGARVELPVVPDPSLGLDECSVPQSLGCLSSEQAVLLLSLGAESMACRPRLGRDGVLGLHPLALEAVGGQFGEASLGLHFLPAGPASRDALHRLRPSRRLLAPTHGRARLAPSRELALACWQLTWLHPREAAHQEVRAFGSTEEVLLALALGEVALGERLALRWQGRRLTTSAGRVAFNSALPRELQFVDAEVNQRELRGLVDACHAGLGERATARMLESLTRLAAEWATRLAFTLGKDDFSPPPGRDALVAEAEASVAATQTEYDEGLLTDGERYNRTIDLWSHAAERVGSAGVRDREERMLSGRPDLLLSALRSGVTGGTTELRSLIGLVGLTTKTSGEIVEVPVRHSLGEGLDAGEFFRTAGRTRQLRALERAGQAARLHRHLRRSLGGLRVVAADCGVRTGLSLEGQLAGHLRGRLLGRVLAEPIRSPEGDVLAPAGVELSLALAGQLETVLDAGLARIRSPLTCAEREGVCAACYGRNPATGQRARVGERVGLLAALAIASELPGLRYRTFHIGGCLPGDTGLASAGWAGTAKLDGERVVRRDGALVATSAWLAIAVADAGGAVLERHEVPRGAVLRVQDGDAVRPGARLAEWDPHTRPVLSLASGSAVFRDLFLGLTLDERIDEVTGLTRRLVLEVGTIGLRPHIEVQDASGAVLGVQHLASGAALQVQDGEAVEPGDVLARTIVQTSVHRPAMVGLGDDAASVESLLYARTPERPFLLAGASGTVEWRRRDYGARLLRVVGPDGVRFEHRIDWGRHLSVAEGDVVRRGDVLCDGDYDPHQVLDTLGPDALAAQLLEGLLELYGVALAPVHLELALRHLLREARGAEPRLLGLGSVGAKIDR